MEDIRVGVHTSISGGVQSSVAEQNDKGGNCGQIFSHSPQSWDKPDHCEEDIREFRESCEELDIQPWVIHESYLVNLCTPKKGLAKKSVESLQSELNTASELGIQYVNVHLGAHTGAGEEQGLENAATRINSLEVPDDVDLVIETDAGGGTKLGGQLEHLRKVQDKTEHDLEFCVDTAHSWAAGYPIDSRRGVEDLFSQFDSMIGLDKLSIIHLNDSKHDIGTNKDEHEHLGRGMIGEEGITKMIEMAGNRNIPLIAETPITAERNDKDNIQFVRDKWHESQD